MTDINYKIDLEIIEKYSKSLLMKIDENFENILFRNLFKFSILRFELKVAKMKIAKLLRKIEALKNNDPELRNKKELYNLINSYLGVSEIEKKKFGEVFTPFKLIEEMLNTLPKEVWSNPHLKWGDFANGIGNFPAVVLSKLMKGLELWEPDQEKRYKHIVEEMLYVCDISPKNMFIYLMIFDPNNKYKMNFYTGSFLEEGFDNHMKNVWGIDKFDIIIGNPPYNMPFKFNTGQGTTGNYIWDKFVIKSINMLNVDGYLNFVHPPGWRKPPSLKSKNKDILKLMLGLQIHYLEIHNVEDGLKIFNAGTSYDFYLLQNKKVYKETTIKGDDGKVYNVNLREWQFIPNSNFDIINNLLATDNDIKCPIIYNRTNYGADKKHVSRVKDDVYMYPVVHATNKSGVRYVYSSVNDKGHYGIKKVIFGDSGINDVVIDINGDYAMSQHAMAIEIENIQEGDKLKKILLSDNFQNILKSLSWSNYGIEWKIFTYLKKEFWKEF